MHKTNNWKANEFSKTHYRVYFGDYSNPAESLLIPATTIENSSDRIDVTETSIEHKQKFLWKNFEHRDDHGDDNLYQVVAIDIHNRYIMMMVWEELEEEVFTYTEYDLLRCFKPFSEKTTWN